MSTQQEINIVLRIMAPGHKNLQKKVNQKFIDYILLFLLVIDIVIANNPPRLNIKNVLIWPENTQIGTIIGNLTGIDEDGPSPLQFKTHTQETGKLVELSEPRDVGADTRVVDIILKKELDRDYEPPERKLYFTVTDSTSEVSAQISLFLSDVNDVKPQFENLPYKATVNESVVPNSVIFSGVLAVDPDNGRGGTVQYSMEVGSDAQGADEDYRTTFQIDQVTGNISVIKPLNYEKHNFYQFKIRAEDGLGLEGIPVDFVVTVLDVQDTPPYFVNLPYNVEVEEDVAVGKSILQVTGIDGDRGVPNSLTYNFIRGDFEKFNIDQRTGVITVNTSLDRDTPDVRNTGGVYAMYVEVGTEHLVDPSGQWPLSVMQASEIVPIDQVNNGDTVATTLVTVTVQDINDNQPAFDSSNYQASILENMQNGVPIEFQTGTMRCSDVDEGTNSHFVLSLEQNGQPYYDFSPLPAEVYSESTILIRVNNSENLDYEKNKEIIFEVVAREVDTVERRSSTATVTLQVNDMNDNPPVFPNDTYLVKINENTPVRTEVILLEATDADDGLYGTIVYSIRGANNKFGIQPASGQVYIANDIDREEADEYYLTGEARDGGGSRTPVEVRIIILDVNDNAPEFRRESYEAILRESDSDFLRPLFVEATDEDQVGTNNSIVKYRIVETPANLESNFTINPDTGRIQVIDTIDYEELDPVLDGIINLKVEAYDLAVDSLSTVINVTITVERYKKNYFYGNSIILLFMTHSNLFTGTVLLEVKASDSDGTNPNNEIIYRIESGALDKFRINFETGQLLVETGARLNREEKDVFVMNVSAIDKGTPPQTGRCTVTVTLTDVNDEMPVFKPASQTVGIIESANVGDALLSYTAKDNDDNSQLQYEIMKDQIKAYNERNQLIDAELLNVTDYFTVVTDSGLVVISGKLDREVAERIELPIVATDLNAWRPAEQTASAILTIVLADANDNAPVFKPSSTYTVKISEGQDIDNEALRVEATDPDKNQLVKFTLGSDGEKHFKIDEDTGIIKIKQKLDREKEPTLTFSVVAEDNDVSPLSSTATVSVTVLDVNDNAPIFREHPQFYTVREDADVSTEVGEIQADDPDTGNFGKVFYQLEGIDSDGTFKIDENLGVISVDKVLDREKKGEYSLVVVATDNKPDLKDQRSNRTTVTIRLDDINDNSPVFLNSDSDIPNIPESSPLDTNVFTVQASDKDLGKNGSVEYSLGVDTNATNNNGEQIFRIDQNGKIFVAADLRSALGLRYVTVEIQDKGVPPLTNSSAFYFRIADVNDDPPSFKIPDPNNPVVLTEEGQPINTTVINIVAEDDDQGENGRVVYSIMSSPTDEDWKKFDLDPLTGRLSNKEILDRETQEKYEIRVRASDNGLPRNHKTDMTIIIMIKDVNDQDPEFSRQKLETPHKMAVLEESSTECVGSVGLADDKDVMENFTMICYYIVSTGLEDTFTLTTSGQLCVQKSIDREVVPYTYLVIKASSNCYETITPTVIPGDSTVPPEYVETDLTLLWVNVSIADINDNKPKFKRSELLLGITKTIQFGTFIYNLKNEVKDLDSSEFGISKFTQIGDVDIQPEALRNELAGQVPFLLYTNGSVKTNAYFRSTMYGYFILSMVVQDKGGKNDTAKLRISLINDNQRLKVIFRRKVAVVGNFKDEFASELQNITGFRIVVDDIRTHINSSGMPELDKTDMFIHGEDLKTNEVVPALDLLTAIDYSAERMVDILNGYNIVKIVETDPAEKEDNTIRNLRMALILVSVILGSLLIILAVAFYFSRRKYQRKLKAATAMAYGSKDSDLYKLEMPGTNIHSYENANPIYLEKILLAEGEEDGQNSLDENAIETNPNYDEQEVTMNIYPEDRDPGNVEGTTDVYLKAALKEHETSKNLKNNEINKSIPNGKLKIRNGQTTSPVDENELSTTRNIDGLQTTEI
ncbi:hypothetical protein LOTGIDRAFT_154544 [Lottia gigantea]|uniref:Cadherin domain-containing protein n=1 Tax=Lottia gigantea TaxID=225164 RepID=V3ZRT8_LOTGI|nr:hypothetical protein LOTGIDRAFT_154544 [Lottia gigantea]ESO87057.1 hypothetical protein LOTGIDRAFT_154544 [Lottia gigantea]